MDDETFELRNERPHVRPMRFETNERTRQARLFDGLDALPGQLDLFAVEGDEGGEHEHE